MRPFISKFQELLNPRIAWSLLETRFTIKLRNLKLLSLKLTSIVIFFERRWKNQGDLGSLILFLNQRLKWWPSNKAISSIVWALVQEKSLETIN
jgi:hypothetical protein